MARHAEAAEDWDQAARLAGGAERERYRLRRAAALARAGDRARAVAEAGALAAGQDLRGEALYQLAGIYATASAVADDTTLADQDAARALELLARARAKGYFKTPAGVKRLREDADLAPLRSREEFRQLLQGVEAEKLEPKE
jgi:hypothetical protein